MGIMNGSLKGGLIFGEKDTLFVLTSTSCPDSVLCREKRLYFATLYSYREHPSMVFTNQKAHAKMTCNSHSDW